MGCLRNRSGSPSGADQPSGGKGHMVDGRDSAWRNRASGPHAHRNTARQATDGLWTEGRGKQKQSNDPPQQPAQPQYTNYWEPLTRKRHTMSHPAQPQHTNHWAPRTRKQHRREHRPQRPTESSNPMQHMKGRMGDCPGPLRNFFFGFGCVGGCACAEGGGPPDPPLHLWIGTVSTLSVACRQ